VDYCYRYRLQLCRRRRISHNDALLPNLLLEGPFNSFHVIAFFANMAFTKACRLALDELDGKWAYKVLLRAVLNVFCALAIAACAFVLTRKSDFQPEEWKEDHEILMYLPYVSWQRFCYVFAFSDVIIGGCDHRLECREHSVPFQQEEIHLAAYQYCR